MRKWSLSKKAGLWEDSGGCQFPKNHSGETEVNVRKKEQLDVFSESEDPVSSAGKWQIDAG